MASEAQVRIGLTIVKTDSAGVRLIDRRYSSGFNVNVDGTKGPSPGSLTIPPGGKVVTFDLTTPALCVLKNMHSTFYIEYGIRDPDTNRFYPVGEILPGEEYVIRLSRNLKEEYIGTGTGTSSATNQFFMMAEGGDCPVSVEAFEA